MDFVFFVYWLREPPDGHRRLIVAEDSVRACREAESQFWFFHCDFLFGIRQWPWNSATS